MSVMNLKLRSQALADLLRRYGAVFGHAWSQRKAMEPPRRLPHEAQFLPAALALQETPLSPAPHVAMWATISFAALAVAWATFGRVDIVATAQGRVVPDAGTKLVLDLAHPLAGVGKGFLDPFPSMGHTVTRLGNGLFDAVTGMRDGFFNALDGLVYRLERIRWRRVRGKWLGRHTGP